MSESVHQLIAGPGAAPLLSIVTGRRNPAKPDPGEKKQGQAQKRSDGVEWIRNHVHGRKILAVGCAREIAPIALARRGFSVVCMDTDVAAIEAASAALSREPEEVGKHVRLLNADFASPTSRKPKADTILMAGAPKQILHSCPAFGSASHLLPNDGRLILFVQFSARDFTDHTTAPAFPEVFKSIGNHFSIDKVQVLGHALGIVAYRRRGNRKTSNPESATAQAGKIVAALAQIERSLLEEADTTQAGSTCPGGVAPALETTGLAHWSRPQEEAARRSEQQPADEQIQSLLQNIIARQQEDRAALQHEIQRISAFGKADDAAMRGAKEQLVQLEVELQRARNEHYDAVCKFDMANEQLAMLKRELVREETSRGETESLWKKAQAELDLALGQQQERAAALLQETDLLRTQMRMQADTVKQMESYRARLEAEHELVLARLDDANRKYRVATEQMANFKQRIEQEEAARRADKQTLDQLRSRLEQANLKYRRLTTDEIPKLKKKLEAQYSITRELQQKTEQLRLAGQQEGIKRQQIADQLQHARAAKLAAQQRVIKTRASLSFQLGYLLIHGFTSVSSVIGLPRALWALRNEALRRRREQDRRMSIPDKAKHVPEKAFPVQDAEQGVQLPAVPTHDGRLSENSLQLSLQLEPIAHVAPQPNLRRLKMACIMDEFTAGAYTGECELYELTPDNWKAQLEEFQPELLFIESAWRGKDELWGGKVGHASAEVQGIVEWCRAANVPTAFWNKEDPVHFETFLTTAKMFDYVFTTDIDCIHRYKAALGHNHVYLLPFACQPAVHNPIETYERKDAFCFAGAYYVRYLERTRDLGNFVAELPAFRPLEIYDRNYGKDDPNYQFPPEYQPYIVGTLPFDQIDKAYKGYRYAINLNSIKQSQSMFARRVFELLASNTITVSNFSRGVRLMFGDLILATDNGGEMIRHLNALASNEENVRKLRLAALRKVMQEHTYGQRLAYIVSKVSGHMPGTGLPKIAVIGYAASEADLESILGHCRRQRYPDSTFFIVLGENLAANIDVADHRIRLIPHQAAIGQTIHTLAGHADMVAMMLAEDYYGPNYLLDIALATRYSQADVIGKGAYYAAADGTLRLEGGEASYRPTSRLPARCAAIRTHCTAGADLMEWLGSLPALQLEAENGLAIDAFNYCRHGASKMPLDPVAARVDDLPGLNTGIGIDEMLARAERIAPETRAHDDSPVLTGKQLAVDFGKAPSSAIKLEVDGDCWRASSSLPDGKNEYLYATKDHSPEELGFDGQVKVFLDTSPGLNIQLVIFFLDAQKQKISHVIKYSNRNQEADIPPGTARIRFGLRFYAGGSAEIKGLVLGHRDMQPVEMLGQAEHLVLTNHYPSYGDLYRNGFVHSRVRAYRERGVKCDVFRLRPDEPVSYHEFENVDVTTGSQEALHRMLNSGRYKTVLVHFLDPAMWQVLQHHVEHIKVLVWVHGAEIQPWYRRDFNYQTEDERTVAKMKSEKRTAFWRELLQSIPANLKLVFVSRYFAEEVMEDLGFRIPENHYTIIHNPIDTNLFGYGEKPLEQRKKVLSIRPYASRQYANDLSVKTIEMLSEKPWFNDMEFRMIGDGPLFEATLAPLRRFPNVHIERRFLKQGEIAALHKDYGVFLCPTRWDSHGVSRDEAMASGLVPVTNAVAAIPEFVDPGCGMLAKAEEAEEMAQAISMLYEQPHRFAAISTAAAARVRQQSSSLEITNQELGLLK